MNPIPVVIIIVCVLAFETVFLGDEVSKTIEPFLLHIDTTEENCGALEVGCAIGNAVRPVLAALAAILNGIIFIAALATFGIPGAPAWIRLTLTLALNFSLIWAIVTLLRGVK